MKPQAKVLQSVPLLRHIAHAVNNGVYYNQNKIQIRGLHPRLWVKAGLVWMPGTDGKAPPAYAYGWMQYYQDCYAGSGDEEKDTARSWPVDPPLWGTEGAPLLLFDYTAATTDGLAAATVAATTGNAPTIPATTRYARARIGHVQEIQSAASAVEIGVVALAGTTTGTGLGGRWSAIASCYPSGPMSDCEWTEISSRFRYGSVPGIVDLEASAD